MKIVLIVWAAAALAMLCCGLFDLLKIFSSVKWLKREKEPYIPSHEDQPFIIILLPVLREQRLITETLNVFAKLKYPLHQLRVFVITTEKELAQQEKAKKRLILLAKDIASKRLATALLIEKYLGIFSEDILKKEIAIACDMENELEVYAYLLKIFGAYPTTIDLVREDVATLNERAGISLFTHLHYPYVEGNMGQQLEYAIKQLPLYLADQNIPKSHAYLAVYNADSRPHIETLQYVANLCSNYQTQDKSSPPVIQQSAIFLENTSNFGLDLKSLLLQSAAILQTRFVLSHELPRLQQQSRSALQFQQGNLKLHQRLFGAEFALCVGHGLFIRYDIADRLNIFSLSDNSDDLLWSFLLCIEHIPILPLPLLESAESPTTVKSLIVQKKNWFLGYTEYFHSRTIALQERRFKRSVVEFVTFHGLMRAIKWLFLSPTVFLAFALPILMASWQLLLIAFVIFAIYGFLTFSVILKELQTLKGRSGGVWSPFSFSMLRKICLVLFSLPAFLIESLGLWWCVLQYFRCAFTGIPVQKQKTER